MLSVPADVAAGPRLNNNQLYKFSYTTEVLLDRTRVSPKGSAAGYRISSDVDAHLVWRDPSSKDDQLVQVAVCGARSNAARPRTWCPYSGKTAAECRQWPHSLGVHTAARFSPEADMSPFSNLDLQCENQPSVPANKEDQRSPRRHGRGPFGEEQAGSSDQTFLGAPERRKGKFELPVAGLYVHRMRVNVGLTPINICIPHII